VPEVEVRSEEEARLAAEVEARLEEEARLAAEARGVGVPMEAGAAGAAEAAEMLAVVEGLTELAPVEHHAYSDEECRAPAIDHNI